MDKQKEEQQNSTAVMQIEQVPYLPEEGFRNMEYRKYPLSDLVVLSTAVQPLVLGILTVLASDGGSGLYYVNTGGKQMMHFQNSTDYLATLKAADGGVGGGQAHLQQIPCDPAMIYMAAALMDIEKKLNDIQDLQQEMFDYLKAREKADIRGNINTLTDVLNNYKFNWDNEKYKTNKHILVQDIRRNAEQSIQYCREQLKNILTKQRFLTRNMEAETKLRKVQDVFPDYQLALYQYSFASFLEILLLENFDADYLDSVTDRISEVSLQYREIYTECYNWLEDIYRGFVQTALAGGVADISKGAGEIIAKIPLISKGPVDEALIAAGESIDSRKGQKATKELDSLVKLSGNCTLPFIQMIQKLRQEYNESNEIYFDNTNLYMVKTDSAPFGADVEP